jgi:DNA repair exonuclease SbcCD ATPase subunit
VGLFDETNEIPSARDRQRLANCENTLFDWLIRKAEADLELAQAFAASETQRADQIKRLEATLVGQISVLQHQVVESREAELSDLKSEIFACADRVARIESAKASGEATREFVHNELGNLRSQLSDRQTELEFRHSGFERVGETLSAQIQALEEKIHEKLEDLRATRGELHRFQSETQSLTELIGQTQSAASQARTLAARNAEQFEQTADDLKRDLAALKADLDEQKRNASLPKSLLKDVAESLGAKLEETQNRLAEEHEAQLGHDARLGQFDSGLVALAGRITQSETQVLKTQESLQREARAAADFRNEIENQLAALRRTLNEAQARESAVQEIGVSLRANVEEWQHQAAQKLMLLESRDAGRAKSVNELEESLGSRLAELESCTGEKLCALASGHEELLRLKPEIQSLAQRVIHAETATQRAQIQANTDAMRVEQLEKSFKSEIVAIKAELSEQQRALRPPDEQMREIEAKLDAKIDELQRQLAIEREGLGHWEKGLRESFSSELSAMQARLSERQSQIEHRYARLDRLEDSVAASIHGLEDQLKEELHLQDHGHEQLAKFRSEFDALSERTSQLESQAHQAQITAAANRQMVEEATANFKAEMAALKACLDARPAAPAADMVSDIRERLGAKLHQLEEQMARKFSRYDSRDLERTQQAEETFNALKNELGDFKAIFNQQQSSIPSVDALSRVIDESLHAKIYDLDQKLAERLSIIDHRDADRAQLAQETIESLRSEISALKSSTSDRPTASWQLALQALEESLAAKVQELQQHVEQKLVLRDKRDAERTHQAQQVITGLQTEMTRLKADLSERPTAVSMFDPALSALEYNLSAKIHELSQHVAQKFTALDNRDAELKELKDRSQSLVQRVTQLSAVVQSAQTLETTAVQPMTTPPAPGAAQASGPGPLAGESPVRAQAASEKEQLIRLQERMSSEIERVRVELKERSGRWKVRKSAS